jgi:hypothetical protein
VRAGSFGASLQVAGLSYIVVTRSIVRTVGSERTRIALLAAIGAAGFAAVLALRDTSRAPEKWTPASSRRGSMHLTGRLGVVGEALHNFFAHRSARGPAAAEPPPPKGATEPTASPWRIWLSGG